MKINIATKLALPISLFLAVFTLFSLLLLFSISVLHSAIFSVVFFILSLLIITFSFQNYLNTHLKIIYNLLYDGKEQNKQFKSFKIIEQDAIKWQEEQQQDLNNLQKQNNYRKEFIGNLSHELKTPLFSIQGYVETLIDGGLEDENINLLYLKKAAANIDRLSAIINDVDTIAKLESDSFNLKKTTFNLFLLVNDVIESLELLADKNDITVEIDPDTKAFKVVADKEKVRTVLVNLITNSIKYGKEGGKTSIKLSVLVGRVLVEVSDNGVGIKKDQLPRIFERFYRVDSNRSREQGGSGLGLAIVKHIIEAHHQTINVKSEWNVGTNFSFTLAQA